MFSIPTSIALWCAEIRIFNLQPFVKLNISAEFPNYESELFLHFLHFVNPSNGADNPCDDIAINTQTKSLMIVSPRVIGTILELLQMISPS